MRGRAGKPVGAGDLPLLPNDALEFPGPVDAPGNGRRPFDAGEIVDSRREEFECREFRDFPGIRIDAMRGFPLVVGLPFEKDGRRVSEVLGNIGRGGGAGVDDASVRPEIGDVLPDVRIPAAVFYQEGVDRVGRVFDGLNAPAHLVGILQDAVDRRCPQGTDENYGFHLHYYSIT